MSESVGAKAAHVRAAMADGITANHHCHWPGGCHDITAAAQYCCTRHWYKIPLRFRNKIWAAYRKGQEIDKSPTSRYMQVVREIKKWFDEEYI